jgi:hypothetical protein
LPYTVVDLSILYRPFSKYKRFSTTLSKPCYQILSSKFILYLLIILHINWQSLLQYRSHLQSHPHRILQRNKDSELHTCDLNIIALIEPFAISTTLHTNICNNIARNEPHNIAIYFDISHFANSLRIKFPLQTFTANDLTENNSEE